MLFLTVPDTYVFHYKRLVSVPSRGYAFLNGTSFMQMVRKGVFPSPLGAMHFLTDNCIVEPASIAVSVPSRGHAFLNSQTSL